MPPNPLRRTLLLASLATATGVRALPAKTLSFPRDFGSHPDFRTEWWYLTGYATSGVREFGFQITFFRSRIEATQAMTSSFAAKQLIFAHAAIIDVQGKKLWHDQRIARSSGAAGIDMASASETDTAVRLRDWSLLRNTVRPELVAGLREGSVETSRSRYTAVLASKDFSLNLQFTETQALLLQGDQGLSRKGPEPEQASYYYSQPQLIPRGQIVLQGQKFELDASSTETPANRRSVAWLDHEWSQALLHPSAVGWDWIGMNLFDGSALTAFRLRDAAGGALWDGGSFRSAKGGLYTFTRGEVIFRPTRRWTSPLSQASYPVEWVVRTPADFYTIKAVIDNQELDSRNSTGAIYWEGLSDLFDSNGKPVGRGYLEMTGYAKPMRM
jgi:predicted secreted hydrolase